MSYPLYSEAVVEGMEDMIDAVGLFTSSVGRTGPSAETSPGKRLLSDESMIVKEARTCFYSRG
jgi:hypothetical protein